MSTICKHCGEPIRIHNGTWVHDDPDEDGDITYEPKKDSRT